MRIRLSDEDRERLGCPEWITYDASKLTNREAVVLQKAGYDPPARALGEALLAQYRKVGDDQWELERFDYEANTAVVWVALHRAGVKVPYDELEFDVGMRVDYGSQTDEVDEGKDPSTPTGTSSD